MLRASAHGIRQARRDPLYGARGKEQQMSKLESPAAVRHRGLRIVLAGLLVSFPGAAYALHGGQINKVCVRQAGPGPIMPGDTILCTITVTNQDTNDALRIDSIVDVVAHHTTCPSAPACPASQVSGTAPNCTTAN